MVLKKHDDMLVYSKALITLKTNKFKSDNNKDITMDNQQGIL
jgi:hypothetical protein